MNSEISFNDICLQRINWYLNVDQLKCLTAVYDLKMT
jgi:hypothetical protein